MAMALSMPLQYCKPSTSKTCTSKKHTTTVSGRIDVEEEIHDQELAHLQPCGPGFHVEQPHAQHTTNILSCHASSAYIITPENRNHVRSKSTKMIYEAILN
jgi:hypothetical protein